MEQGNFKLVIKIYAYIIIVLLILLGLRLAVVQLFHNDVYQTKAKDNRIRLLPVKATRGEIVTSDGVVLANNELVYTLSLTYISRDRQDEVIEMLVSILGSKYPQVTADFIKEKFESSKYRLYEPVVILRDLSWDMVVKLEEKRQDIPGLNIDIEPLRAYPQDSIGGHVLGYIHSISAEELAAEEVQYNLNSLIGKSGIEKQYEKELRGQDGARQVEVDARGRPIGELVTMQPKAGKNIQLTIDYKLQAVMDNALDDILKDLQNKYAKAKVGSAVLMNVKTGGILALSSKPDMYPDDWKGNISAERAKYYFPQGDYNPLNPGAATNRAIQVAYPPGSTFKAITGMAALEKGTVNPANDFVNCPGHYWLPPYIGCTGVHGNVNYYSGMATSCNTYFQEMGRRASADELIKVAKDFGLGEKTGLDLPFETKGLVPTPEWKYEVNSTLLDRKYNYLKQQTIDRYNQILQGIQQPEEIAKIENEKQKELTKLDTQYAIDFNFDTNWQEYDTFNMSIGQGGNNYTVIQLANYMAAIANGGRIMKPYLLDKVYLNDGTVESVHQPERIRFVNVSSATLEETKQSLLQVTQPGGTAYFLFANFPENIKVAAKTGTAETGRSGDNHKNEFHGVFIAFAPYDDPQIAFAGVVEYGYHGSGSAGYVAKAVFEQYFGIKDHYAEFLNKQSKLNNSEHENKIDSNAE